MKNTRHTSNLLSFYPHHLDLNRAIYSIPPRKRGRFVVSESMKARIPVCEGWFFFKQSLRSIDDVRWNTDTVEKSVNLRVNKRSNYENKDRY